MTRRGEARALLDGVLAMPSWPEQCIDWPFGRIGDGYGAVWIDSRQRLVHVVACEHRHGPRPDGMEARHLCGRGHLGCFNPAHLEWGTRQANVADKLVHGTHDRGERNVQHKLTEDDVRQIRRMYVGRGGPSQRAIADQFGIGDTQVYRIIHGQAWGWLGAATPDELG